MRKFILLFLLAVISTASFATDPIKFGVTAGISQNGITANSALRFGYSAGVISEIPITSKFYFVPSLQFSNKHYYLYFSERTRKESPSFNYIDLPLQIKIKSESSKIFGKNMRAFISVGPTISYSLSLYNDYGHVTNAFEPGSFYALKRFNYSAGINIGVECEKNYLISIGYNRGINKMSSVIRFENVRQNYLSLTLSYFL